MIVCLCSLVYVHKWLVCVYAGVWGRACVSAYPLRFCVCLSVALYLRWYWWFCVRFWTNCASECMYALVCVLCFSFFFPFFLHRQEMLSMKCECQFYKPQTSRNSATLPDKRNAVQCHPQKSDPTPTLLPKAFPSAALLPSLHRRSLPPSVALHCALFPANGSGSR